MEASQMLVRFCQGRPVGALTTAFLTWACPLLWERGMRVLVLFWNNASWHISAYQPRGSCMDTGVEPGREEVW